MEKTWHCVGKRIEIETRKVERICIQDRWIALLPWNGKIYAIEDECPHQGASLCYGDVSEDGYVKCPLHSWEYHVKTGLGREDWEDCVAWFLVKDEDGVIFVEEEEQFGEE